MAGKLDEIGTTLTKDATKIMLLGAGELGQEQILEAQRFGIEVVAVDRYENAPGHRVADRHYKMDMRDAKLLRALIEKEEPDVIIPEIEAINLDELFALEKEGYYIVPNAKATHTAMQRKRLRELISKDAGVLTSKYAYAMTNDPDSVRAACEKVGYPCVIKAIQSSSGLGSSDVRSAEDVEKAIEKARKEARGTGEEVIVEEFIKFDTEVTELVVQHLDEDGKTVATFPKPLGHVQIDGDYHSSWMGFNCAEYLPLMPENTKSQNIELAIKAEKKIYEVASKITSTLAGPAGRTVFGCELFVKQNGDDVVVYGNESTCRPHDTGLVTLQAHANSFSQFGMHIRAVCGLPIPGEKNEWGYRAIKPVANSASHVILSPYDGHGIRYKNLWKCMNAQGVMLKLFGKPSAHIGRRMGVVVATAPTVLEAKRKAEIAAHAIEMKVGTSPWKTQTEMETRKHIVYGPNAKK